MQDLVHPRARRLTEHYERDLVAPRELDDLVSGIVTRSVDEVAVQLLGEVAELGKDDLFRGRENGPARPHVQDPQLTVHPVRYLVAASDQLRAGLVGGDGNQDPLRGAPGLVHLESL